MNKAAFYDLDGTLLSCNLVTMQAYYARNHRSLVKSAYQFTKVVLSVPLFFGLDLYSRSLFNVFSFRAYRGMHRDRLIGLADDLFEVTLKPSIFPQAKALIDCTRDLGYRNVLVTGTKMEQHPRRNRPVVAHTLQMHVDVCASCRGDLIRQAVDE